MPTRGFCLVLASVFLAFGILGFVSPLVWFPIPGTAAPRTIAVNAGYGALFGIFSVNYVRDIVQVLIGVMGLLAARSPATTLSWCRVVFIYSAAMVLMGILPMARTLFGVMPAFGWNVGFHFIVMMMTFYFAIIHPLDRAQPEPTA